MLAREDNFEEDGASYYEVYMMCPVCFNRGYIRPSTFWLHGDPACESGRLYVGDNAHYYCKGCKKHSHVSNWKYKCPGHSNTPDEYICLTSGEMACVIGLCARAAGTAGIAWLKRFLENLDED